MIKNPTPLNAWNLPVLLGGSKHPKKRLNFLDGCTKATSNTNKDFVAYPDNPKNTLTHFALVKLGF